MNAIAFPAANQKPEGMTVSKSKVAITANIAIRDQRILL